MKATLTDSYPDSTSDINIFCSNLNNKIATLANK